MLAAGTLALAPLDTRVLWSVYSRKTPTGSRVVLEGLCAGHDVDLRAIAHQLYVPLLEPTHASPAREIAGPGWNNDGRSFWCILRRIPANQLEALCARDRPTIKVITKNIPRGHDSGRARTELLTDRAQRITRLQQAGLVLTGTGTRTQDKNHYRLVDFLRRP